MNRLGVSKKARSRGQFIDQYEKAGNLDNLPDEWKSKRNAFISRHLAQYKKNNLQL